MKRLKIGPRLAASFTAVTLCMLLGSLVALRQLQAVQGQTRRMAAVDQRLISMLRVHNDVLAFRSPVDAWIEARDPARLEAGAAALRRNLLADVDRARETLRILPLEPRHQALVLTALEAIAVSLPAQLDLTLEMAKAGDWEAAARRFDNQFQTSSEDTRLLAEQVGSAVALEQQEILASVESVHRSAMGTLLGAALFTVLAAVALGFLVTRRIARPLARVTAGAEALARGDFEHHVSAVGDDELAQLARVFNATAAQLKELYGELERSKDAALAKVKVLSGLLPICAWCKKVRDDKGYWNQLEVYVREHSDADFSHGICPECKDKVYAATRADHPPRRETG